MSSTLQRFSIPHELLSSAAVEATTKELTRMTYGEPTRTDIDKWNTMVTRPWAFDGKDQSTDWWYCSKPGVDKNSVTAIPFWVRADGKLIISLENEARQPFGGPVIGFPAGGVDKKTPLEALVNELEEELGVMTTENKALSYGNPAALAEPLTDVCDTLIPFFIGTVEDLSKIRAQDTAKGNEEIIPHWVDLTDLPRLMTALKTTGETPNAQLAAFDQGYKFAKLEQELTRRSEESQAQGAAWEADLESVKEIWNQISGTSA